jgi:hypothetical protein
MDLRVNKLDTIDSYSEEIRTILDQIVDLPMDAPGIVIETCMGQMARCTEIHVHLSQIEFTDRKAKVVRTLQLKPVMELIEFLYRGASRMTEIRRQELEMSK